MTPPRRDGFAIRLRLLRTRQGWKVGVRFVQEREGGRQAGRQDVSSLGNCHGALRDGVG